MIPQMILYPVCGRSLVDRIKSSCGWQEGGLLLIPQNFQLDISMVDIRGLGLYEAKEESRIAAWRS
jgi:hypothetical protein